MHDRLFANKIIRTLRHEGFYAECPCCEEPVSLKDCDMFYLDDFSEAGRAIYEQYRSELIERREELRERRKQISHSSEIGAYATNIGLILERLAPALGTFRYECGDCRSLFDPIDYVIFEGLCRTGIVSRIIFADIKTGNASLSRRQREIRDLVNSKKVEFDTYEAK